MKTSYTLETFRFKNRPYLLLIAIPLVFLLFIITFYIYFSLQLNGKSQYFFATFIVFIVETFLIISLLSKFRYVPNGKLIFNSIEIEHNKRKYNWKEVKTFKFYYRGDMLWKSSIPGFSYLKSYNRYNSLHWTLIAGMDENILDKIQIQDEVLYIKIRNQQEKKSFIKLKTIAEKNGIVVLNKS